MTYCPACGTRLEEGTRFCQQCGTPVRGAPPQPPAAPSVTPEEREAEAAREAALWPQVPGVDGAAADVTAPAGEADERSADCAEQAVAGGSSTSGGWRGHRRLVTIAAVAAGLLVVVVILLLRGGGLGGIPDETMRAALGTTTAEFVAEGTCPGPPGSGEMWSVYRTQVEGVGGPAWVYLDEDERVRRVDNFSAGTLRPPAADGAARDAAEAYLQVVEGPALDELVLRSYPLTPGRPATVMWQQKEGDVWLPSGVSVQVGREGTVVGYQWIDTSVTVSLEPDVTVAEAAARVGRQLKLGRVRKTTHELEVLDLDPEQDGETTQYLVWSLTFSLRGEAGTPGALAIVDAHTGQVLSAARMTL